MWLSYWESLETLDGFEQRRRLREKCGSRTTSLEAPAVIQLRGDHGLDRSRDRGGCEKWLDFEYLLKAEPTGFADRLDVGDEGRSRVEDWPG